MFESLFSIGGMVAMAGWAGLIFLPKVDFVVKVLARVLIPGTIALVYIYLFFISRETGPADGGFGSLAQVKALFQVDALLLAGWVHYLAFDLFIGSWEVSDARKEGVHHLLVIPCLVLTFLAGPVGLLLYFLVKYGRRLIVNKSLTKVLA